MGCNLNVSSFQLLYEELREKIEKVAEELQKINLSCSNFSKAIDDAFTGSKESLEKMEPIKPVYDISWIRKCMKCCKNPMERKQLEKQLNAAYKARKKARNKR